jgi:hypothetical protein
MLVEPPRFGLLDNSIIERYYASVVKKGTLAAVFANPVRANLRWGDIEAMLKSIGAAVEEREGVAHSGRANGVVAVFHRPHPNPHASRPQVRSVRRFLMNAGVRP